MPDRALENAVKQVLADNRRVQQLEAARSARRVPRMQGVRPNHDVLRSGGGDLPPDSRFPPGSAAGKPSLPPHTPE